MAFSFYRVFETPDFVHHLERADPAFVDILYQEVHPILALDPTAGDPEGHRFRISYEPPFFSIYIAGEGGWRGVILYEVLEDERLVLLYDFLWERAGPEGRR